MYQQRLELYRQVEAERKTKVIAFSTGNRKGMETNISGDTIDFFTEHLDRIGNVPKISLFLYTLGGDTLAAYNIVNLIREFCSTFEIIIPNKCRSAGTLMALGADNIIMTKQATLGPIDPSLRSPLNPIAPNTNPPMQIQVSVESVKGYFGLLKKELGVSGSRALSPAYIKLSEHIHPLLIGDIYRTQRQILMLATKLLQVSKSPKKTRKQIISFLCSDSGSHDYPISRTEARNMGLRIESPTMEFYTGLKRWYNDIAEELCLFKAYSPVEEIGDEKDKRYLYRRAIIESVEGGQDAYISEGILSQEFIPVNGIQQRKLRDNRIADEWRHLDVR